MADKATERPYRIGVDVGGTNTDAVLISLNPVSVIASHKALTTPDVTTGITNAIHAVLDASGVSATSVACVIVGTTHFVNAIVQRSSLLRKVAVVRLCGGNEEGFGRNLPPFVDFPEDLSACIDSGSHFFCNGGYQITGEEISPIDTEEIQNVAKTLVEKGVSNIVISGMYAPLNHSQEVVVNGILSEEIQKRGMKPRITMSHEVSGLGYLKRENAAILNATLRPLAEKTVLGFEKAMEEIFGENPCTLFLTQNDGSVLNGSDAISQPIRTFNSGPTNSIRGGELLWRTAMEAEGNVNERRTEPLVVVDIGGTTADSGLLLPSGLPQMSSVMSLVGGVRTNFALPAVESIGVGGGSIVRIKEDNEDVIVGPDSVALNLFARAKLFGGDCLTCSDIVAARSLYSTEVENPFKGLGDLAWLSDITPETIDRVQSVTRRKIEELVDRSKVQKQDVDLLIVGGGAAIVNLDKPLAGVRAARTVNGGEVANAVGAAISRVSGTVDTVVDTSGKSIKEAQEDVCKLARQKALDNGAKEETIEIADISILPIQYVEAKARIIVRAVGELSFVATSAGSRKCDITFDEEEHSGHASETNTERTHPPEPEAVDLQTYRPTVEGKEWVISSTDLDFIAAGCKILGCGGGGDPYQEYLKCKALVRRGPGRLRVISPDSLFDDGLYGWTGCMGSPEVSMERLENDECLRAHEELMRATKKGAVDGFVALEIGGGNGMVNLGVAAQYGAPCVDADYMGRAYPTCWQITLNVHGTPSGEALVPMTIASGDGSSVTLTKSRTDKMVDKILRASCVEMGCRAGTAGCPKPGMIVKQQAIANTVSLAWWIGRAAALEKNVADKAARIVEEAGGPESAAILGYGKVTSVERVLKTGHTYGVLEIEGSLADGTKATLKVPFKNENAFVEATTEDGQTKVLASVPDLIAVIDSETGAGLGTPEYKYGLKVAIIAIAASPQWTSSERGMEIGGPASMGFDDIEYVPIGKYSKPRSIIDVFST